MFYAVFAMFFVSSRWLAGGLFVWALLIVVMAQWGAPSGWLRYPLSMLNIEFMMGIFSAWLVRRHTQGIGVRWAWWLCGIAVFVTAIALMVLSERSAPLRLLMAAGLAMVIVASALGAGGRWPIFLVILGNASYSIYLVHNPLLSLTQRLLGHTGMPWGAAMLLGVVLGILAGWVYYLCFERPAYRVSRQLLRDG